MERTGGILGVTDLMATTQELLADAKAAHHKLMTGQAVVKFRDSNGEEVSYSLANAGRLAIYISELERKLTNAAPLGPMRIFI